MNPCMCKTTGPTPIEIKYFDDEMPRIPYSLMNMPGDWIDLRVRDIELINGCLVWDEETSIYKYYRFTFMKIWLGVAMNLPDGYEAHVSPRGSMFKNTGLIQTNSTGVVDNSYCGDNDEWFIPVFSLMDGKVSKNQRIVQFRIMPTMKELVPCLFFDEVDSLNNPSRGGDGSTGKM